MKTKTTINLILLVLAVFTFSVMSVNAIAIIKPANGGILYGSTVNANINVNISTATNNVSYGANTNVSCNITARSTSTANSSWTFLGIGSNATADALNISITFNSNILEDSNNYIVNASCFNTTTTKEALSTASIIINNSKPDKPSALSPKTSTLLSTATTDYSFSSTVVNKNTTSCTYTIARGGATSGSDYITGTGSYSASSCTFTRTFSGTADNGEWWWSITAGDGTENTNSGQNILSVQIPPTGSSLPTAQQNQIIEQTSQQQPPDNTFVWIIVIAIAVIVIIVIISKRR